ncbi:MAG: LysM peptidoglycan-binding domain-containing protein [Bacteroidetes bacterium]|jgi:LysM repeat protein|nr:LysM peptidoglycan-binding domain-containing protein [Bacteroidota bacterium]
MQNTFLIFLGVLSASVALGKITPEEYIASYKQIAIDEMHRAGIPASITLAQGYLESGCGNSELAVKANNHFGIKCHTDWKGDAFYIEDDDYDENGELKKSCFRVYRNAEESYVDHSDFLTGRSRYAFLFELRTSDYKGWAHGLKKAGYATNPKYGDLLISIIERYGLQQYDLEKSKKMLANNRLSNDEVFRINDIPAIAYDGNMSIRGLRDKYFTAEWQIFKYNDIDPKTPLRKGMILYLKPKRRSKGHLTTHTVQESETMQYISQLRGIKLKKLYKLNGMAPGEEAKPGEVLTLKDKRGLKPNLYTGTLAFRYFTILNEGALYEAVSNQPDTDPNAPVALKNTLEKPDGLYHEVGAGETLMSIARAYNKSWEEIKEQNGLTTDNLTVGQILLIEPRKAEALESTPSDTTNSDIGDKEQPSFEEKPHALENAAFHTVQKGETLFAISRLYGLTVAELMFLNRLENPSVALGVSLRVR